MDRYDPLSEQVDFFFGTPKGSKVETLYELEPTDDEVQARLADMEYFRKNLWRGLKIPNDKLK